MRSERRPDCTLTPSTASPPGLWTPLRKSQSCPHQMKRLEQLDLNIGLGSSASTLDTMLFRKGYANKETYFGAVFNDQAEVNGRP